MAKPVSANLKHYYSSPQQPQHVDCVTRTTSWCSFQRGRALGTINHKPIKDPIPICIQTLMNTIFDKLGSEKYLDGCRNMRSPNRNESFYYVLWGMALI